MMAEIVTVSVSTTAKETAGMTLEEETETLEAENVAETAGVIQADAEVLVNPSLTEVVALQKGQVVAADAAVTISVNRATIILADEFHSQKR